jgi:hypothetical protein
MILRIVGNDLKDYRHHKKGDQDFHSLCQAFTKFTVLFLLLLLIR